MTDLQSERPSRHKEPTTSTLRLGPQRQRNHTLTCTFMAAVSRSPGPPVDVPLPMLSGTCDDIREWKQHITAAIVYLYCDGGRSSLGEAAEPSRMYGGAAGI